MILGIESSCDETAMALVDCRGEIKAQALSSQISQHQKHGGVVPELASRSHYEVLEILFSQIENQAQQFGFDLKNVECVASTRGPGLVGPLLVGSTFAEGLALGWGVPYRGIHHLRGHLASALLTDSQNLQLETLKQRSEEIFPGLVLLVSGGHTQVLKVNSDLTAESLIHTVDDAAGECLDKIGKLLGLPYPGGPEIEKCAEQLIAEEKNLASEIFKLLPRPQTAEGNFSFSGLKTAARLYIEKSLDPKDKAAFCWAIQKVVCQIFELGIERVVKHKIKNNLPEMKTLVFCGGVSANKVFRNSIKICAESHGLKFLAPPLKYSTDNAAMIAAAAFLQPQCLDVLEVSPRIPLELGRL